MFLNLQENQDGMGGGGGGGRRSVQEGLFKEVTALVNIFYENLVTF